MCCPYGSAINVPFLTSTVFSLSMGMSSEKQTKQIQITPAHHDDIGLLVGHRVLPHHKENKELWISTWPHNAPDPKSD